MNGIERKRREKGITQEELAELLGVSQQCVSQWEKGIRNPRLRMIIALAELFGCTIDELLRTEEEG